MEDERGELGIELVGDEEGELMSYFDGVFTLAGVVGCESVSDVNPSEFAVLIDFAASGNVQSADEVVGEFIGMELKFGSSHIGQIHAMSLLARWSNSVKAVTTDRVLGRYCMGTSSEGMN